MLGGNDDKGSNETDITESGWGIAGDAIEEPRSCSSARAVQRPEPFWAKTSSKVPVASAEIPKNTLILHQSLECPKKIECRLVQFLGSYCCCANLICNGLEKPFDDTPYKRQY